MANENNIGGLISTNNPQITSNGLSLPPSFNEVRTPKMLTLFERNSNILYTKFSYYTDGEGKGSTSQQPFFAVNPSNVQIGGLKGNSSLNTRKKTDSRTLPFVSSEEDVIRIRKFLGTSAGTKFTITQFLLQGLQPFNETKIYNPLMPIIASARPGTLGLISRPNRFVELNASGIFGALGLKAVSTVLFGNSNPTPPPGTATGQPANFLNTINPFSSRLPGALPVNRQDGGKGLTRGRTASAAYKNFTDYWSPKNKGLIGKLLDVGNYIRSETALGALLPVGQPSGTRFKGDENSYDLMVLNGTIQKPYESTLFGRIKSFFVGSSPEIPRFVWVDVDGNTQYGVKQKWANTVKIKGSIKYRTGTVNQSNTVTQQTNDATTTKRYSDVVKNPINQPSSFGDLGDAGSGYFIQTDREQSEILVNYDNYINNIKGTNPAGIGAYPTKLDSPQNPSVQLLNAQLLGRSNDWETLKKQKTTHLYRQPKSVNNIVNDPKSSTYLNRFSDVLLSKQLLEHSNGKRLGSDIRDPINMSVPNESNIDFKDKDLIKFWFYDIANNRYIPFRATVKSINERYTSDWDNFQYVGNADKVYNYKGFTRSLGFTFTVLATTVYQLLPMWKRINYLLSLSKPAKYFNNEFIVPPLVKLTIGDLYENQPIVITNMSLSIPDNATWETLPQETVGYNYYNGLFPRKSKETLRGGLNTNTNTTSTTVGLVDVRVAQMPMEADLTIDCNILEVDKPEVMDTANFGWVDAATLTTST